MRRNIHLTHRAYGIKFALCLTLCLLFLTAACKNGAVTEVAQANPNQAPTSPPAAPGTAGSASPTASQPSPAPSGTQVPAGQPSPGASPSPSASIRFIDPKSSQGKSDSTLVEPPPTPTPTPAPTPVIEMVNGKIKQQWQASAEYASMKSPLKVTPDIVKKGQYLYKNKCEICHGTEGKGNGPYNSPKWKQSTNLASQVVQANSDGELFYKVSTSRDRHPSTKVLYSEEERWMIVAFLRTLK